jgi:DNA-binding Lrp family transcriptional regulator
MAIPDFSKLGLSAILIGMDVDVEDNDKVIEAVKQQPKVKFLWKTYGDHQVVVIMTCERGFEGQAITELRNSVAKLGVNAMHISVGYEWEKIDFVPC